jgi:hypothetical protein
MGEECKKAEEAEAAEATEAEIKSKIHASKI